MPLYGNELDRDDQPVRGRPRARRQARASPATSSAATALEKVARDGPARRLVGLDHRGPRHRPPRLPGRRRRAADRRRHQRHAVADARRCRSRWPTSRPAMREPGTIVDVEIREHRVPAQVVPLPFYKRERLSPMVPDAICATPRITSGSASMATRRRSASPPTRPTSSATSSSSSCPRSGRTLEQFATFGVVESVKAVSDLFAPAERRGHRDERRPRAAARSSSTATRTASGWMIRAARRRRRPGRRPARRRRLRRRSSPPADRPMPYGPHTADDRGADARGPRPRPRSTSSSRTSRPRSARRRSTCPSPSPSSSWRPADRPGRAQPDRSRLVPRRRRLPPLEPARGRPAAAARRVVHGLHAVPARDQPGHAPEHLRVRVAARRADRPRRRLGVALRRRRGDGRGRADDLPGDRAASASSSRAPSTRTTAQTLATYFDGGLELEEIPLVADGAAAGTTDLAALERMLAETGPAGRRRHRRAARLPRPARADGRDRPARPRRGRAVRGRHRAGLPGRAGAARARTAPTSRPARASRSASRRSTAARTSGSSPRTDALVRQIPGRLVGMTTDLDGQRAYVMTLRAREQDIRRDKAASNICTNQALLALAATIYLATIGPHGLRDVAALGAARAAELEAALAAVGVPRLHPGPYLNEFVVRVPDARDRPSPAARGAASSPAWSSPTPSPTTRPSPTACSSARPRSPRPTRSPRFAGALRRCLADVDIAPVARRSR